MAILKDRFKELLTIFGYYSSAGVIEALDGVTNYLEVGRWMRARGFDIPRRVENREKIFDRIAVDISESRVLYLEFGVHHGASMVYWSKLLRSSSARLHGFDSFEGLPEKWHLAPRGTFATDGVAPVIDDPRVTFFKGWFEEVLPSYSPPNHDQLVINLDADIYSSTAFVLNFLASSISVGTFLYFDEFSDRFHELRAFDEFLSATRMGFRIIGATKTLKNVAFQRIS